MVERIVDTCHDIIGNINHINEMEGCNEIAVTNCGCVQTNQPNHITYNKLDLSLARTHPYGAILHRPNKLHSIPGRLCILCYVQCIYQYDV